jgi:hypothetical protein
MIDGVHPIDEARLSAAVDQIAMLTKLVEDLRTLALAEGGALALRKEPTDLAILTQEAATSFEGLAATTGVRLAVQMPADLPLVDVDPLRIQQVIGNLVANALRYASAGPPSPWSCRLKPGRDERRPNRPPLLWFCSPRVVPRRAHESAGELSERHAVGSRGAVLMLDFDLDRIAGVMTGHHLDERLAVRRRGAVD